MFIPIKKKVEKSGKDVENKKPESQEIKKIWDRIIYQEEPKAEYIKIVIF